MSSARLDSFEIFLSSPQTSGDPEALPPFSFSPFPEAPNSRAAPEQPKDVLKRQYLEGLRSFSATAATLRQTVVNLLNLNVKIGELINWAVTAGFDEHHVRKLLSRLLLDAGLRRRKSGAGPRVPKEALLLFALARDRYGDHALRFLRAACRVARAAKKKQFNTLIPVRDKSHTSLQPMKKPATPS